jgi:NAD(P)-dependent dehydrogenase (short-subunit alcohol dehydrogenase family)
LAGEILAIRTSPTVAFDKRFRDALGRLVMGALEAKVAVVTGAASGIGRACALRAAAEGARVVAADVQDGAAVVAAAGAAAEVLFQACDVAVAAQVEDLMRTTVARHGRLDVLIAAAGVSGGTATTAEYGDADFDRVIAVNLKGVFLSLKHALRAMLRGGGGAIVTIASVAGLVGLARTPAYSAAKGAVIQLSRVAALEYADHHIRVNCICPGMIDTPMVQRIGAPARQAFLDRQPLRRLGTPEEVAAAAVFLASDAASFTTGSVLAVDGGYTAQ